MSLDSWLRRRHALVVLLAVALVGSGIHLGGAVGTAAAGSPAITATPNKFGSGQRVKVNGSGFDPGVSVVVWFDGNGNGTKEPVEASTRVVSDATGSFAGASIDVFGAPGSYRIRASGPGSSTAQTTITIGTCWIQDEGCTINGAHYDCLVGDAPSEMISDCKAIDSNYSDPAKFPNGWDLKNVGPRFGGAGILAAAAVSVNPIPLSGCVAMTEAIALATGVPYNNIVPDPFDPFLPTHGLLSTACGDPLLGIPPFDLNLYIAAAATEAALPGNHGLPDPALDDAAIVEAVVTTIQAAALIAPGGPGVLVAAQKALAAAAVDGAIACGYVNYYCNGSDITGNIIAHADLQKRPLPFLDSTMRWGDLIGWAQTVCHSNTIPADEASGDCSTPGMLPDPGSAGYLNVLAEDMCATGPIIGLSIGYDGDLSFDINDNPDPESGPGPAVALLTNYHNFLPGPSGSEPPSGIDIEIPLADRGLFMPTLEKLRIGTRVTVCGRWVADMNQSWNELHPIRSITILDPPPPVIKPTVAMVKDINPGLGGSVFGAGIDVNGVLFFAANDAVHGFELWKSDGTAEGTVLVKDIHPFGSSLPQGLEGTNVNGTLFFRADGGQGAELWKSDGTAAGTVLVRDINPGTGASAFPQNMTNVNGVLYFTADDGALGRELWMSDGTAAGTVLVKDINPSADGSSVHAPGQLTNVDGRFFFTADDGVQGRELWTSDGTPEGTHLVADFTVPGSSFPYDLTNVGGTLFFGLTNWIKDGVNHLNRFDLFTLNGLVKIINPTSNSSALLANLTDVNGTAFFTANDGVHGRELWRSNGSEGSTQMVKDIEPAYLDADGRTPGSLTNVNGTLFFTASDGIQAGNHGGELWKSDGTEGGTVLVKDIYPGPNESFAQNLINVNGVLFFRATDGIHGGELWMSDGTAVGTVLVADVNPGAAGQAASNPTNVNGTVFFQATDGIHGVELWATRTRLGRADSATGAGPVSFETSAGALVNLRPVKESSLPAAGKPAGVTFPFGFFGWTIADLTPGQTTTIRMRFPSAVPLPPQYWKVDNNGVWANVCLQLPCAVTDGNTLELAITDGGAGDLDGTANGSIRDPGGPGSAGGSQPPVASAGPDQAADEAAAVTLDGSASTGSGLSFAWSQVAGHAVLLSSATSPTPSFTAPLLPGGVGANQTLTFRLTVSSGGASSTDTVDVRLRNADHPPVADAGADQTVDEEGPVTLSAVDSFDPDGDPLVVYQWTQTGGPAVVLAGAATTQATFAAPLLPGGVGGGAILTFQVTVSDGPLTSTDEVVVTVEQVNHPPIANAGTDQTKQEGSPVTLNGTGSSDPDGDALTYTWSQVSGPPVTLSNPGSPTPGFTAPAVGSGGATVVLDLVVSDGMAASVPGQVRINVLNADNPPACNLARPSLALLWPANHKLVPVEILGATDSRSGQVTITITGVKQDEPVNGPGDGDTSPDAVLQGGTVLLRAERAGDGNGRVYEVSFMASDGQGGSCTGSVRVGVPRSMKAGTVAIDDGQLYDATRP